MKITSQPIANCSFPLSPSNTYYIGDPCYVFPDQDWHQFCDALDHTSDDPVILCIDDEPVLIVQNTAYGDGEYPILLNGTQHSTFGVDAGLFSIIPIEFISKWGGDAKLGSVITFTQPSFSSFDRGVLQLNTSEFNLVVNTNSEDEEDCEDDYFEEDYYDDEEEATLTDFIEHLDDF